MSARNRELLALIPSALLLTGYLGGATATQVRVEDPWFLFPIAVGVLIWGALWLRDPRVVAIVGNKG